MDAWLQPNETEFFCGDLPEEKVVGQRTMPQRWVLERTGGSSHVPMLSQPEAVAKVIIEAADSIQ